MPITELLAQFADPNVIHTLSVTDKLIAGLMATILGMGVTFTALIILQSVIILMDTLVKQPSAAAMLKLQIPESPASVSRPASSSDDELISVITSVIALQLKTPVNTIIIRNIERIDLSSPIWNRAGIIEQMNSRL